MLEESQRIAKSQLDDNDAQHKEDLDEYNK